MRWPRWFDRAAAAARLAGRSALAARRHGALPRGAGRRSARTSAAAALCVAAAVVVAAGCAAPSATVTEDVAPLLWPGAPDAPRIAFVRTFSRPEDLGIDKGVLARIAEFVFGSSDAPLVRPAAVVAVDGVLFVADPGARGVHRYDVAAGRYDLIRGPDSAPLLSPVGLARGAEGAVLIADSASRRVYAIARGAGAAQVLPLQAEFRQPTGIAYDAVRGRLYVVDTTAHCIRVFDRGGVQVASIGERGGGAGQFNYPTLLWRSADDRLWVTDALNYRVQILDGEGRAVGAFGRQGDGTGDFGRQKGIATDSHGHVYVMDALFGAMQIFDDAGRLLLSIGETGQRPGEFWLPAGVFIGDDDTIYVADSYNRRVQVFRYVGGAG